MTRTRGSLDEQHHAKRAALVESMIARLALSGATKPSLRQLAESAGVSVATLRHYFRDRDGIIEAVLKEWNRRGEGFLALAAQPDDKLHESLHGYLRMFVAANRDFGFAGIVAVGLVEGLLHETHGPAFLDAALDPMLGALEQRLAGHAARGELKAGTDLRLAALSLLGPLFLSCLHQMQLFGAARCKLNLDHQINHQVEAFVAAFAK